MNQITWEEQILDNFVRHTMNKAEELSGLEFYLSTFETNDTLNLEDEFTYFVPLENTVASGFFYLGLSKKDLTAFAEHTLFRLSLTGMKVKQAIPLEQILIEFAKDLYEVPEVEDGSFREIDNFFTDTEVKTNFIKFEDQVNRDCLYFELENEEFGVTLKCKCMFHRKE